ncbi:unnamed protein product, partial [Brassica oleracea]
QIQHHPYDSADHNTLSTRNTNISSMSQRFYYVNYMLMKKKVKQYAERIGGGSQHPRHVQKDFSRTLDTQVFYCCSVDHCQDDFV